MSQQKYPLSLGPGQQLGQYPIVHLIGRGRTAEVYRAVHPGLNREVALKVMYLDPGLLSAPAELTRLVSDYRREVGAFAALRHPNIMQIYDYNCHDNTILFLVMELVNADSLRDVISRQPTGLNSMDALRIFSQISNAIAYTHEHNVVHGNIKPDNVLFDSGERPVLTDFATPHLAEYYLPILDVPDSQAPVYLAPEQLMGQPATVASDIYALGILLYEMITGDVPFTGGSREEVIDQHLHASPVPPGQIVAGLDPRVENAILCALNKNPAERYPSARAMLYELEEHEESSPYDTLALSRSALEAMHKRRSEVLRFQRSRADTSASDSPGDTPATKERHWGLIVAVVAAVLIALALIMIILV